MELRTDPRPERASEPKSESRADSATDAAPATYVTQSKFFTPEFNGAIFDGPIRIYFAQHQEALALKVYLNLQERFGEIRRAARGVFRERGSSIFVLLYPNAESFDVSFEATGAVVDADPDVMQRRLGADYVLGVRGPLAEERLEVLYGHMDGIVRSAADVL